jgi:hypothetical protein
MALSTNLLSLLRVELQTDPRSLGYAALLGEQKYAEVCLLLERHTGDTQPRHSIGKEAFLLTITGCGFRIAALPETARWGWMLTLQMILASSSVTVSSTQVQTLFALGISQGVVTQQEVDALTLEPCTRSEAVLGRAGVLTAEDVQAAWET